MRPSSSTAPRRRVVWSVAGSDSGAGAGIQADLRAFDAFDALHGCTAIAAVTAQNSVRVARVEAVATGLLEAQLDALAADLAPRAVKTGVLGSVANLRAVAARIDRLRRDRAVALVVDPVWRASSGADLGSAALRDALRAELLPRATVVTPNRAEAAWLLGVDAAALDSPGAVAQAAEALRALGPQAVVVTGGDAGGADALDWIETPQASGWLGLARVATPHHHGSGCVFAASLAAALALGFCHADAAVVAKLAATDALRHAGPAGAGAGAVRPRPGFAARPGGLPWLAPVPQPQPAPFAPLAERDLGLYAVVDRAERIEQLLAAGVRTLQLRIKGEADAALAQEVARAVDAARRAGAQLFVNDHWQLALAHGAYGVHLGQDDLGGADLDALRRAGLRLGVSTHSFWEVCRARAVRPSYVACGPIHATATKAMPWWPQGPDNLAYWCRVLAEPVVAIAGMDAARGAEAVRCGAAGVAVLRGLAGDADPGPAVDALRAAIGDAARDAPRPAPPLPRATCAGPVEPGWRTV